MFATFLLLLLALQKRQNEAALIVRRNESARASLTPAAAIAERNRRKEASSAWSAVTRQRGTAGDLIELADGDDVPTDAECQRLFGSNAQRQNSTTVPSCGCTSGAPMFRHDIGECVAQIGQCPSPISFRNGTARQPPLLSIGVPPPSVGADSPLFEGSLVALWKDSAVKVRVGSGARCSLAAARRFNAAGVWQLMGVGSLLRLGWTAAGGGQATIFWQKTAEDVADLTAGTLLAIDLLCGTTQNPTPTPTHCMTFRVEGRMANPEIPTATAPEDDEEGGMRDNLRAVVPLAAAAASSADINVSSITSTPTTVPAATVFTQPPQGRFETILIILLVVLLFLSVVGSAILWRICWRMKKSELISNLQMQFLYHIKQEKEKAACAAAASAHNRYRVNSVDSGGGGASDSSRHNFAGPAYGNRDEEFEATVEPIFGDQPSAGANGLAGAAVVKRKLYFSAEFFDPFFMANPPPMAEQFLLDLRRMIVIAKQRIAQRRHVPQLAVIHEEEAEISVAAPKPIKRPHHLTYNGREDRRPSPSPDASPRSAKSADSGRESLAGDSSSSSSSGGEEADGAPNVPLAATRGLKPPPPPPLTAGISPLKPQHFLPFSGATATTTHRQNPCFRPPTGALSSTASSSRIPVSKSPRLQTRPFLTATTAIDDCDGEPDSYYHKVAAARPPPILPPPPPPPPARQSPSRPTAARRNAYAVFPSDSMLKKSLPRRSKKSSGGKAPTAAPPPTRRTLVETRI